MDEFDIPPPPPEPPDPDPSLAPIDELFDEAERLERREHADSDRKALEI